MQQPFLHSHKCILLADDDVDDRDLFMEALSEIDATISVTMKTDGEELMEYLQGKPAPLDAIFLDLNMPRKNGKECLLELRSMDAFKNVPIVVYTTSLNPVDIDETFTYGATFFLRKPNSFEELKETLAVILQSRLHLPSERTLLNFIIKGALDLA